MPKVISTKANVDSRFDPIKHRAAVSSEASPLASTSKLMLKSETKKSSKVDRGAGRSDDDVEAKGEIEEDDFTLLGQDEETESFVESAESSHHGTDKRVLQLQSSAEYEAKQEEEKQKGVIYLTRIPPGMKPPLVRSLMSQYGEVGRIYLQPGQNGKSFTEGWVEFADKRIARRTATMCNAQPVGGKRGSRFWDDIWTIKYLSKFKWKDLSEQVAHEAAIHRAKLRHELSQSAREQKDYLNKVELGKKRARKDQKAVAAANKAGISTYKDADKVRSFKQRPVQAKKSNQKLDSKIDSVLGSVFG